MVREVRFVKMLHACLVTAGEEPSVGPALGPVLILGGGGKVGGHHKKALFDIASVGTDKPGLAFDDPGKGRGAFDLVSHMQGLAQTEHEAIEVSRGHGI